MFLGEGGPPLGPEQALASRHLAVTVRGVLPTVDSEWLRCFSSRGIAFQSPTPGRLLGRVYKSVRRPGFVRGSGVFLER